MIIISIIYNFIVANPDLVIVGLALLYFIGPKLYMKIKKDGYQPSDVPEAINEGVAEYKSLVVSIENVIKDVTVNDADTVKAIISMIDAKKKL